MKTELDQIFFHVEKVESASIAANKNMEYNSDNSFAILAKWETKSESITQENTIREKTLNYCSDVYQLVRNQDVLKPLIPVLEEKFKFVDLYVSNDKDAQFSVRVSPVAPSVSVRNEVVLPLITFTNSYDGKVQAQATGGMVRHLVDEKGIVHITFSTYLKGLSFSYKFKHNNERVYDMLDLSGKIDTYLADFSNVTEQVENMKKFEIKHKSIEDFLTKMAQGTIFPLKDLEETLGRVHYESMILDTEPNLWTIYNSMNYITEYTEKSLTKKMRMDVDAKIYVNMLEYMESETKKQDKKAKKSLVKLP